MRIANCSSAKRHWRFSGPRLCNIDEHLTNSVGPHYLIYLRQQKTPLFLAMVKKIGQPRAANFL